MNRKIIYFIICFIYLTIFTPIYEIKASQTFINISNISISESFNKIYFKESGRKYLYRRIDQNKYVFIRATDKNSYEDTDIQQGTHYTYIATSTKLSVDKLPKTSQYEKEIISSVHKPIIIESSSTTVSVTLKWNKNDEADKYYIYRREKDSGSFKKIKTNLSHSFTDKSVSCGKTYEYKIKACITREKENLLSESSQVETVSVREKAIKDLQVYNGNGQVMLKWQRVPTCDYYYIYKKTGEGNYNYIGKVQYKRDSYTNFDILPGEQYQYRICAASIQSYGTIKSKYVKSSIIIGQSDVPAIQQLDEKGFFVWSQVSGVDYYEVLEIPDITKNKSTVIRKTRKNTYQIENPKKGYYYSVRAVNSDGIKSEEALPLLFQRKKYNLNLLFDGDSITYGKEKPGKIAEVTYPERIGLMTCSEVTNLATSGKCLTAVSHNAGHNISEQVKDGKVNYQDMDIIFFAVGSTDYNFDAPIGNINSYDITTFCGAYNYVLDEVKRQNKDAKIVLITPNYRIYRKGNGAEYGMNIQNNVGHTQQDYCDAIEKIAKKHNIYVYNSLDANIIHSENLFYTTIDCLHPNQETYVKIGEKITEFLMNEKII